MVRWESGTSGRLSRAALELFFSQGFDGTTVEQIAATAGVTSRTFFRHYADKEEVLFSGDAAMQEFLVVAVKESFGQESPRQAVLAAVRALAQGFEANRGEHLHRAAVLDQNPRLRGRQLVKQERWCMAVVTALVHQGVDKMEAQVAVGRASLVLSLSYDAWSHGERTGLVTLIDNYDSLLG